MTITIYQHERAAGLADVIAANRVALASVARPGFAVSEQERAKPSAKAAANDADLFPFEAVLVSTGWNRNDDVFDPHEVWAARHTPEDKKFDYEHDDGDIIGHITSV